MRTAIVTGSFDPFTVGHYDLVVRAAALFDKVVVLMGVNPDKKYHFSKEARLMAIRACFPDGSVEVESAEGMLFDFAGRYENPVFVRGVRNETDLEYELVLAAGNRELGGMETVLLPAGKDLAGISSGIAREAEREGNGLHGIVPEAAIAILEELG